MWICLENSSPYSKGASSADSMHETHLHGVHIAACELKWWSDLEILVHLVYGDTHMSKFGWWQISLKYYTSITDKKDD